MKVKINGTFINFFDKISIALSLDSVASSFAFLGRYNPANPLHVKVFKPLSFANVEIYSNEDVLMLTGVLVNHSFNSESTPTLWQLSGYSKAGILEDVTIDYDQYPLESLQRNLKDITQRLISRYGIGLVVDSSVINEVTANFSKSVASPSETIKSYLAKLAAQRNIVMSHNAAGDLVYYRPDITAISKLRFTKTNTLQMALDVNGQAMHSRLTILRQPSDDGNNITPVDAVDNPLVAISRPSVNVMSSGEDTDTKRAANNMLAAELKNIKININLDRILALTPGDIVEVENDELFITKPTRFMVHSISISEDTASENMSLSVMLPESFTGDVPKPLFV